MLKNLNDTSKNPKRVVILGSKGFVGSTTQSLLEKKGIPVLPVPREKIDLTQKDSNKELANILNPSDTLLFVSAKAPVKNNHMLLDNIHMAQSVCEAIQHTPVNHVIYISSDAVYADSSELLNESSPAEPSSLHGVMHLTREVMLKNAWNEPLCILRPTLIYGLDDPHNGYGPNRFLRQAQNFEDIILFGEGEEQRDHVSIMDVAELILLCILHKSVGILNIATGEAITFRNIADKILEVMKNKNKITLIPRSGSMPHNGYRAFDSKATQMAFPKFKYHSILSYLENYAK